MRSGVWDDQNFKNERVRILSVNFNGQHWPLQRLDRPRKRIQDFMLLHTNPHCGSNTAYYPTS